MLSGLESINERPLYLGIAGTDRGWATDLDPTGGDD